jgi:hypothetical protein
VGRVRILNRKDCCGNRLGGVKVYVDETYCGQVQPNTRNGQWYEVKCSKDILGEKVRLVMTKNDYLSISGFEAYSGNAPRPATRPILRPATQNIPRPTSRPIKIGRPAPVPTNTKCNIDRSSVK